MYARRLSNHPTQLPANIWIWIPILNFWYTSTGCSTPSSLDDATLPPESSAASPTDAPTDSSSIPPDSADPTSNLEPEHVLLQQDDGVWYLSPSGSSPSAVSGFLWVREFLDGSAEPACELEYSLTGTVLDPGCSSCTFTFRILHALVQGDPGQCHRDDLPEDNSLWTLGFEQTSDNGRGQIYYDVADTGVWLPWYDAAYIALEDEVSFSWEQEVGVILDD